MSVRKEKLFQHRMKGAVKTLLKERAAGAGMTMSEWVRLAVERSLGYVDGPQMGGSVESEAGLKTIGGAPMKEEDRGPFDNDEAIRDLVYDKEDPEIVKLTPMGRKR